MKKIMILTTILFGIGFWGCTKEPKVNVENQAFKNENLKCNYNNLVIDSSVISDFDQNNFYSNWELISYFDISACKDYPNPDTSQFLKLKFNQDGSISGNSTSNTINGSFLFKDKSYLNLIIGGTKVGGESDWILKFRNLIQEDSIKFQIVDSYLILYLNSQNYAIILKKI